MLLEAEKISIRRHLNIAFAGIPGLSQTLGLRTLTRAGNLELYMNAIAPGEETVLVGAPYGEVLIFSMRSSGDTYTFTVGGVTTTYVVTPTDVAAPWPQQTIATNIAQAFNNASTGVIASAAFPPPQTPPPSGSFGGYPQAAELYFQGVNRLAFTITATGPGLQLAANGSNLPHPQLSVDAGTGALITVAGILPICDYLESSFLGSDARLSFNQAGATSTGQVIFNRGEMRQRRWLYLNQVRQMAVLLGFSLGTYEGLGNHYGAQ